MLPLSIDSGSRRILAFLLDLIDEKTLEVSLILFFVLS